MHKLLEHLIVQNEKKIVLLVLDGLGGLPREAGGRTELETACTPHLDKLAKESECGMHIPIDFGIPPGSAPGHLALFGYEPLDFPIGRGVVAAMGIGFPLEPRDVAARMNFATQDADGNITDRRAGRIPTEKCAELCELLKNVSIPGVQVFIKPVKDYRAVVIFRGTGLSDKVADTDTQKTGVKPLDPVATEPEGEKTAGITKEFIKQAFRILKDLPPTNACLLRGFAELPSIPGMKERDKLNPLALAVYPDYKGVSRLVGMKVIDGINNLEDQMRLLKENWNKHDYFFIHHKYTDSKGEDGDFDAKVKEIEKVDAIIPQITALNPDVLIVTGDHSTPAVMKAHSGHPVPFLLKAMYTRPDDADTFGERACARGFWGNIRTPVLLQLALSYADKIMKYGA
ncbi:MAG: 2,3-bisphosphoglycerate-independent phosphoglycerate mutase [Spirochaetales bacterium]|nr:2,3-bisphosphoglycerate-independent phosphoglycerate mutase [Spirochaetales bacterium]